MNNMWVVNLIRQYMILLYKFMSYILLQNYPPLKKSKDENTNKDKRLW